MSRFTTAVKALSTKMVGSASTSDNATDALQHIADNYTAPDEQPTDAEIRTALETITGAAVGDIFYLDAEGHLARLPVGTDGQVLKVASGLPSWATQA